MVAELAKVQAASPPQGLPPGYLSAFPEELIDRVEARQRVWAPYYTLHKIMAGLLDMYQLCGNPQALDVLTKMADWVQFRMDRLTDEQLQACSSTEFGGMNEVLANLYALTGDPEHLRDGARVRSPAPSSTRSPRARGPLDGLHANTQIPRSSAPPASTS